VGSVRVAINGTKVNGQADIGSIAIITLSAVSAVKRYGGDFSNFIDEIGSDYQYHHNGCH
jgi:hypothetical protein